MADIFISYASGDRPRAETLRRWFSNMGWSVWIDGDVELAEAWSEKIQRELDTAHLVVVLWGSAALRSEWVRREATTALASNRLVQIHGTGLRLPPPFDGMQAVRMQSWSGEGFHSERYKLLSTVANRLGVELPPQVKVDQAEEDVTAYKADVSEVLGLAFYYCARQVERVRLRQATPSSFEPIRDAFNAMLALLRVDQKVGDDREGILHRLTDDFLTQLQMFEASQGVGKDSAASAKDIQSEPPNPLNS